LGLKKAPFFFAHAGEKKIGVALKRSKTKAGQIGMKAGEFPPWC
jgi:hypothetical protein